MSLTTLSQQSDLVSSRNPNNPFPSLLPTPLQQRGSPHTTSCLTCCIFSRSRLGLLTLSPYPCRCLLQGMTCSRPAPTLVKINRLEAGLRTRGWSLSGGEALNSTGLGLACRSSARSPAGWKDTAHRFFTSSSLEEVLLLSLQQASLLTWDHFRFSEANSRWMRSSSSSELWRSRLACKRARTLQHWVSWLVARGVKVQCRLLSGGRRQRSGRADLHPVPQQTRSAFSCPVAHLFPNKIRSCFPTFSFPRRNTPWLNASLWKLPDLCLDQTSRYTFTNCHLEVWLQSKNTDPLPTSPPSVKTWSYKHDARHFLRLKT